MPLKQLWRIVRAEVIGDGRGEVPLVRRAIFGSMENPVGLLEDLQVVGEQAVVFQKPSDEGGQVIE
jgi:hypothetical protein